ncbi:MAG: serine/threonine-protein kinase [bacterium]
MKICPSCKLEVPPSAVMCPRDGTIIPLDSEERSPVTVGVGIGVGSGTGTKMLYDPLVGELLDKRYKIETRLGEGALSTVYASTHLLIEKRVAVKVLKQEFVADPEIVERFLREAKAASRLSHPNIIGISDFGKVSTGAPFFVMELLDGRTLHDLLEPGRPLAVDRAVNIALEIGRGVAVAHQSGVVHRDLKPENIGLVRDEEGKEHVKILDFGLAKITQENRKLTRAGQVLGTPEYMSPEQASGSVEIDHRTDIFSLGILLYRLVSGVVPFAGESFMAVITRLLSESPESPRKVRGDNAVSPALDRAILRALARSPEDRFPTMDAMLEALRLASTDELAIAPTAHHDVVDGGASAAAPVPQSMGAEPSPEDPQQDPTLMPTVVASGDDPPRPAPPPSAVEPPSSLGVWQEPDPPTAERVRRAGAELADSVGDLWVEEHTAQRVIRRSAAVRSRRRSIALALSLAVLGISAGVFAAVWYQSQAPESGSGAGVPTPGISMTPTMTTEHTMQVKSRQSAAPVMTKPAVDTVAITLLSVPPGAAIIDENRVIGYTPLTLRRPMARAERKFRIFKQGFRAEVRAVDQRRDTTTTVRLTPLRRAPPPRRVIIVSARQRQPPPMRRVVMRPRPRNSLGDLKDPFAPMTR